MEWSYETLGASTYLVCRLDGEDTIDNAVFGMLTNNRIPGLAAVLFHQADDVRYLKYDVTAKVAASHIFKDVVDKARMLGFLKSVISTFSAAEDYMIHADSILLDLDCMFIDVSTNEVRLICLPVQEYLDASADLRLFFKSLLTDTKFSNSENSDYVVKLLGSLNTANPFVLEDFGRLVTDLSQTRENLPPTEKPAVRPQQKTRPMPPPPPPPEKRSASAIPEAPEKKPDAVKGATTTQKEAGEEKQISLFYLLQHYNPENKALYDAQKKRKAQSGAGKKGQKTPPTPDFEFSVPGQEVPVQKPIIEKEPAMSGGRQSHSAPETPVRPQYDGPSSSGPSLDFGDTVDLFEDGPADDNTVELNPGAAGANWTPYVLRRANGEKILISKPIFRIGREQGFVDYLVNGNKHIGHLHCHIVIRGGEYFVVDDNSKNHTFVDGEMLQPSREYKIAHGQVLRLADEEFEFRLY